MVDKGTLTHKPMLPGRDLEKEIQYKSPRLKKSILVHGDKNIVRIAMPSRKIYTEIKPDPAQKQKSEEKIRGEESLFYYRKIITANTAGN